MIDEKAQRFCALAECGAVSGTLKNVVLSSPVCGDVQKIKGTPVTVSGQFFIQLEFFCTEGRVRQKNVDPSELAASIFELIDTFNRCELNDAGGSASLMRSKKGKVTLLTRGKIGEGERIYASKKEKNYILDGSEPFLYHLGISDKAGRVHDKKQAKYRQINRFLEHVGDAVSKLPTSGVLRIADLCCGKSYLSFAVYYYLTAVLGRDVAMDCVALKASVMDFCRDIAEKCGFVGMSFSAGDISKYAPTAAPQLVISLHACDTATDIVLDTAVRLGAEVILSTPCCHRQLSRELNCAPLAFAARNSILKSKMCDALTDALRVLRLEAAGYSTDAVELIDPDDTPKNVLIRAYRSHNPGKLKVRRAKLREYREAYSFLCGREADNAITEDITE